MRIWLFATGENWPTDGVNMRILRMGNIARCCTKAGDEVVWFSASYWHIMKRHRFPRTTAVNVEQRLTMIGLHGPAYPRNIGVRRLVHNWALAREFERISADMPKPDIMVACMPIPELALAAVRFGRKHGIPVVVDIRDFWPDIWLDVVPDPLRPVAKLVLQPYYRMLRQTVDGSTALCGVSEMTLQWALDHGSRARTPYDAPLPLAYELPEISDQDMTLAKAFWASNGLETGSSKFIICYFGNFSARHELVTLFEAMERVPQVVRDRVRVVLCGVGDQYESLRRRAESNPTFLLPGWMDTAQMEYLKRISNVGLAPYPSSFDYTKNLPNKTFDYLVSGLPILSCLKGVMQDFIEQQKCGWVYENHDVQGLAILIERLCTNREIVHNAAHNSAESAKLFDAARIFGSFRERLVKIATEKDSYRCAGKDDAQSPSIA